MVEPDRPQVKIEDGAETMRFACRITKATVQTHTHTHTHLEYVILITFQLQQWLRELASVLRYTYIVCLVSNT
jgi:hypothetical protein